MKYRSFVNNNLSRTVKFPTSSSSSVICRYNVPAGWPPSVLLPPAGLRLNYHKDLLMLLGNPRSLPRIRWCYKWPGFYWELDICLKLHEWLKTKITMLDLTLSEKVLETLCGVISSPKLSLQVCLDSTSWIAQSIYLFTLCPYLMVSFLFMLILIQLYFKKN